MKTFKLLLTMVLCLALIFTCATSFTSCKPKNDAETNEDSSSNNTSDENSGNVDSGNQDSGNTDSGNTDSGNNDSGNGNTSTHTHSYDTSAITKYPGVNAKGEKTFYCSCGDSYTEEIEAVTVVLPSFANVLAEMIGEHTYGLEISSGSEIVLVKEARESGCSPDGPTYDNGFKDFLAVKVAEASVSGEGGVFKGMLKVEIGYVNVILDGTYTSDLVVHPDTFDTILTLDLYVNGDAVSVSAGLDGDLSEEEIEDISREIYSSIANSVGLTYDQLVELYYISGQLKEYAPLVDGVVDVINSINMSGNNADLNELVALIASTIMDSEQDGNNTIYTIRAENLSELIDNIDNKTVVELIDAKYGEGSAEMIAEFVKAIPTTTVRQLVDKAADFSDSCGIPIEQVYALINYTVDIVSDMEFDITEHIENNANLTVAAIIAGANGIEDVAAFEKEFSDELTEFVDYITVSTLNELYLEYIGTDDSGRTLSGDISMALATLDDLVSISACVDENGNLVWAYADLGGASFSIDIDGSVITISHKDQETEMLNAVITLADNGEIYEIVGFVKYTEVEYETIPDYGDYIPEVDNADDAYLGDADIYDYDDGIEEEIKEETKVVKEISFRYSNECADDPDHDQHYIVITTEDIEVTIEVNTEKIENGDISFGGYCNISSVDGKNYTDIKFQGTFDADTVSVGLAIVPSNSDIGINIGYFSGPNEKAIDIFTSEGDVLYRIAYKISANDNGVQILDSLELIVGTYAYSYEDWYDENEGWNYESERIYYQPVFISYIKNDDETVEYHFALNGVEYLGHTEEDDYGNVIRYTEEVEIYNVISINGDETGFIVEVAGYDIYVDILENGFSTKFEVDGEYIYISVISGDDFTVTISDEENTLLFLLVAIEKNYYEFYVNYYDIESDYDEITGEYVEVSKELVNAITATLDGSNDGKWIFAWSMNDVVINLNVDYTENSIAFDVDLAEDDVTLLDGAIGFECVSTENSDKLVIDIDFDKIVIPSTSNNMGSDNVHDSEGENTAPEHGWDQE